MSRTILIFQWLLCGLFGPRAVISSSWMASLQETDVIETSKGPVIGIRMDPNPATGVSYDAFLGIPYGEVPARFLPPIPRSKWSSPLHASKDGPACPQIIAQFSEDCLYLNVFTPLNASKSPEKFPVMAYIHGSAFTFSSSSSFRYGPDFLVPQDIILVTMNYRLGAPGFLTLGSEIAPGNLGIYDTRLALQWIQEEIEMFGGDPKRVTLFGQSAGSAITQFHYISPDSSGLFKYTIAQSGSALSDSHILSPAEAVRRAKLLAVAVGCNINVSDKELLSCLQDTDINLIVNKQNVTLSVEDIASGKDIRFRPVLDTEFAKPPFFTDFLDNLMKEALLKGKPLMTGFVTEEGVVKFESNDNWKTTEDNLGGFIPERIQSSLNPSQKAAIVQKIRNKYFPKTVDDNKILDLVKIYGDTIFVYPNIGFARYFSNFTFGYIFTYKGSWTPMPYYFSRFQISAAYHGAELLYLFYQTNSSQDLTECPINLHNLQVRDMMVRWWTSFAKTGTPDLSGEWRKLSEQQHYLIIDSSPTFINTTAVENLHYNFWVTLDKDLNVNAASDSKLNILVIILAIFCLISMTPCLYLVIQV